MATFLFNHVTGENNLLVHKEHHLLVMSFAIKYSFILDCKSPQL